MKPLYSGCCITRGAVGHELFPGRSCPLQGRCLRSGTDIGGLINKRTLLVRGCGAIAAGGSEDERKELDALCVPGLDGVSAFSCLCPSMEASCSGTLAAPLEAEAYTARAAPATPCMLANLTVCQASATARPASRNASLCALKKKAKSQSSFTPLSCCQGLTLSDCTARSAPSGDGMAQANQPAWLAAAAQPQIPIYPLGRTPQTVAPRKKGGPPWRSATVAASFGASAKGRKREVRRTMTCCQAHRTETCNRVWGLGLWGSECLGAFRGVGSHG